MAARFQVTPKVASSNPTRAGTFFAFFQKPSEFFIKTTFLGVKNHEEHETGVKKISTPRKTL